MRHYIGIHDYVQYNKVIMHTEINNNLVYRIIHSRKALVSAAFSFDKTHRFLYATINVKSSLKVYLFLKFLI